MKLITWIYYEDSHISSDPSWSYCWTVIPISAPFGFDLKPVPKSIAPNINKSPSKDLDTVSSRASEHNRDTNDLSHRVEPCHNVSNTLNQTHNRCDPSLCPANGCIVTLGSLEWLIAREVICWNHIYGYTTHKDAPNKSETVYRKLQADHCWRGPISAEEVQLARESPQRCLCDGGDIEQK